MWQREKRLHPHFPMSGSVRAGATTAIRKRASSPFHRGPALDVDLRLVHLPKGDPIKSELSRTPWLGIALRKAALPKKAYSVSSRLRELRQRPGPANQLLRVTCVPTCTARMVPRSSLSKWVLSKYARAPSFRASWTPLSFHTCHTWSNFIRVIRGQDDDLRWGNSLRIATIASRPFIAGICRSISVMSGRCCRNC